MFNILFVTNSARRKVSYSDQIATEILRKLEESSHSRAARAVTRQREFS